MLNKKTVFAMKRYDSYDCEIESGKTFREVEHALSTYTHLTKAQKRAALEKLIKFSKTTKNYWDVVKIAKKIDYSLTDKQNERIVSALLELGDDQNKIEDYARSKGILLHYFNEITRDRIAKILG